MGEVVIDGIDSVLGEVKHGAQLEIASVQSTRRERHPRQVKHLCESSVVSCGLLVKERDSEVSWWCKQVYYQFDFDSDQDDLNKNEDVVKMAGHKKVIDRR